MKVFYDGPSYWRVGSPVELSAQVKDLSASVNEPEACGPFTAWDSIREGGATKFPAIRATFGNGCWNSLRII